MSTRVPDGTRLSGRIIALPAGHDFDATARVLGRASAELIRFTSAASGGSDPLDQWLGDLSSGEYDDVVFVSGQAVRLVLELARLMSCEEATLQALQSARTVALGRKAVNVLRENGLRVDVALTSANRTSTLNAMRNLDWRGRVVGIAQRTADADLLDLLSAGGAAPRPIGNGDGTSSAMAPLVQALINGSLDVTLFAAAAQVARLLEVARQERQNAAVRTGLDRARVFASSSAALAALKQHGIRADGCLDRALLVRPDLPRLLRAFWTSEPSVEPSDSAPKVRAASAGRKRVVVIGNGMVGHKFCEKLAEYDTGSQYEVVVFCEEPRAAYDRVRLTSYFESRDADLLSLSEPDWYKRNGFRHLLGESAVELDRERQAVLSSSGEWVHYDKAVICTGSVPFVPPLSGVDKRGVFVYRTIDDLDQIIAYSGGAKRAVVLGGGLLGLEAAKAVLDLGLETHVVESAPRLMPRQLDAGGARLLEGLLVKLGLTVHVGVSASGIVGEEAVEALTLQNGEVIPADLVIISTGIRARDELARDAGIAVAERGGIVVDDELRTSDPAIHAIGECAAHRNVCYGLVAPGYEMADALARSLCGTTVARFDGADQSAKLKLLGVDVASFGSALLDSANSRSIVYEDLVKGVYKKLVLSKDGKKLLGGILVGDAGEYGQLVALFRGGRDVPEQPESLILTTSGERPKLELDDAASVCSCNGVTAGMVRGAIREQGCASLPQIKKCTKAGTGCGGCLPMVTDMLAAELLAAGKAADTSLCEHFSFSRRELYEIVKINRVRSFTQLLESHGRGNGCEVCKPVVASILASVFNEPILKHDTLQDSNDRFLANLQRSGLYSVVPRIPAGEITPEKLIVIGEVAKKYGLYTKITGGQRIDLFGARLDQLPDIWEALVKAGFESGHAYGKAMRTVKSCVGSTWCRYGVQDSVSFAIRIEERYKGIRAPHKLKSAVSGCIRECAEAQSKDFGVIATERGWNLYVGGNGGAKPRHADLLASDLDERTVIALLDRFIMYYIKTADRLARTSTWLDKMDGGIEHLRDVIIKDKLGICAQLEKEMQYLVDTYTCEWADVVNDPERRARFRHFATAGAVDTSIELVDERGQKRPADWARTAPAPVKRRLPVIKTNWVRVAAVEDVPTEGGITIDYGGAQIAVFNFASRGEWYACQNMCPHTGDMVLARGLLGDQAGQPKVACPMHKKTFSLVDGSCLAGDVPNVVVFPVRVEDGAIFLDLPPAHEMRDLSRRPAARSCATPCETAGVAVGA
jgi:nitrite reductase (NADH) large subunit